MILRPARLYHLTTRRQWTAIERGESLQPRAPDAGPAQDFAGIYTFDLDDFLRGWDGWAYRLLLYLQFKARRRSESLVLVAIDVHAIGYAAIRIRPNLMVIETTEPEALRRELAGEPLESFDGAGVSWLAGAEYIIQQPVPPSALTLVGEMPAAPALESPDDQVAWLRSTIDGMTSTR